MKKIFSVLLSLVIICLSFTSCKSIFSPVDELMRPPRLSGDDKKLQEAFEKSVAEYDNVVMKIPISGKYKSSYNLFDIDGDDSDETIILYSVPFEGNSVIAEIFKYTGSEWVSVSKINTETNEIYEINFADINGDGCYEVLLGLTDENFIDVDSRLNLTHILNIYTYDGEKTELVAEELYSNIYIKNLNNDNTDELILFRNNFKNADNLTSARIISYNNDYSISYDNTTDISDMLEIQNIVSDKIVKNNVEYTRVFVDGSFSDTEFITEIIEIDESNFNVSLPLYSDNMSETPGTLRRNNLYCMDIGFDGTIEVPSTDVFPYSEKISEGKTIPLELVIWSEYDDGFTVKYKTLLNSKVGHVAFIPDEFIGNVSVIYDEENLNLTFYSIDGDGNVEKALFSYRIFTVPQWEENSFNYEKIHENDTYVYSFLIFNSDNYDYYKKYISESFYAL